MNGGLNFMSVEPSKNTLKVIVLGLENKVFEAMKKPSFSVEALTRELRNDNIQITAQSIRKFIRKSKKAQAELISKDLQAAEQFKQLTINYGKALKDILTEVEEVKNAAKDEKDYTTYNQLIGRLMQGIELIAKLAGDIKPKGSVDINLIYNEITTDVDKRMRHMKHEIFTGKVIDVDAIIKSDDEAMEKKLNETDEKGKNVGENK